MKTPQKQVYLIGIKTSGHNILQACELTPDLLKKRLVLFTGNTGQGKSTLLDICKASVAGNDAIKKKDILPKGFLAESQLIDGDIKLYAGVSVEEYSRGEKKGDPKYEVFLYAKDNNGKQYVPIIDGVAATASQYMSMLTTELTFSLPDLYSENQATHRKLIERLFKPELDKLGAESVIAKILEAKNRRDGARALCQGNGAYMEQFEAEGYKEAQLSMLSKIDIASIDEEITQLKIDRDRLTNAPESAWKLECSKLDQERTSQLQAIKDKGLEIKEAIRVDNEKRQQLYDLALDAWENEQALLSGLSDDYEKLLESCKEFLGGDNMDTIKPLLDARMEYYKNTYNKPKPESPSPDPDLAKKLQKSYDDYTALQNTQIKYPEKKDVDTSNIDKKIESLLEKKLGAEKNNNLYNRYQLWLSWIEAKGLYEKEIDVLRKLYASIDCGVKGMNIVPKETDSGRVDVWIMYDGSYDPAYFANPNKEQRFMFEYSSFQRTIIGLMLQAARLDLKPKALRLAFVDDVAFTSRDISVLSDIAEKLDLKLITAWTHEAEKEELLDGQVLIEGGEVFFDGK